MKTRRYAAPAVKEMHSCTAAQCVIIQCRTTHSLFLRAVTLNPMVKHCLPELARTMPYPDFILAYCDIPVPPHGLCRV